MGMSLQEVIAAAGENQQVGVTVVTLQDDGLASYASGTLLFHPGSGGGVLGGVHQAPRLTTSGTAGLNLYRSDQVDFIDVVAPEGGFSSGTSQPFSAKHKAGMNITITAGVPPIAVINNVASVVMETREKLLVGVGPFIDPNVANAVWVIAFTGLIRAIG